MAKVWRYMVTRRSRYGPPPCELFEMGGPSGCRVWELTYPSRYLYDDKAATASTALNKHTARGHVCLTTTGVQIEYQSERTAVLRDLEEHGGLP